VKIVQIYASSRYMCEIISTKGAEIRYYSTLSSARKRSKLTLVHAIALFARMVLRTYEAPLQHAKQCAKKVQAYVCSRYSTNVLAYVRSATETRVINSINGQN
jgi:predicted glutamine amidotransferase